MRAGFCGKQSVALGQVGRVAVAVLLHSLGSFVGGVSSVCEREEGRACCGSGTGKREKPGHFSSHASSIVARTQAQRVRHHSGVCPL